MLAVPVAAWAGAPLVTDDPGTPGEKTWEINLSHTTISCQHQTQYRTPLFDINYGTLENDQWHLEVPVMVLDQPGSDPASGLGDIVFGYKYRFLEEDDWGFSAAVFPQILLPTGRASAGLGLGLFSAFCPLQIGRHFADEKLYVYGQVGYAVVPGDANLNFWNYGIAAEWSLSERIELLGEFGGAEFSWEGHTDDIYCDFGFRWHLDDTAALMATFGRNFHNGFGGEPEWTAYVGVQFVRGGK